MSSIRNFNPSVQQRALFDTFLSTPGCRVMLNAGPGTGKTKTLEELLYEMRVADQCDTRALCFNVSIADEMRARFPEHVEVVNFHKLGNRIVGQNLPVRTKLNKFKYSNIIEKLIRDNGMYRSLGDNIVREYTSNAWECLRMLQAALTDASDDEAYYDCIESYDIEEFDGMQDIVAEAHQAGLVMARRTGEIDFNDMICLPYFLGYKVPKVGNVLVDECQDLSPAQAWFVTESAHEGSRILAVGDPRQAIYGFAGASYNSFDQLKEKINGIEMPLSVTFRCPKSHVEKLRTLYGQIDPAENAIEGEISHHTYMEEMKRLRDSNVESTMILCRVTAPLVKACFDLLGEGIPAKIKGRDIQSGLVKLAKDGLKAVRSDDWSDALEGVAAHVNHEAQLVAKRPNPSKLAKLDALRDKAKAFSVLFKHANDVSSVKGFDYWLGQFFDENVGRGCTVLSTVHKAKGLEGKRITILAPEKMPHPMASTHEQKIQENNIQWVAYSRSKQTMNLVPLPPKSNEDDGMFDETE